MPNPYDNLNEEQLHKIGADLPQHFLINLFEHHRMTPRDFEVFRKFESGLWDFLSDPIKSNKVWRHVFLRDFQREYIYYAAVEPFYPGTIIDAYLSSVRCAAIEDLTSLLTYPVGYINVTAGVKTMSDDVPAQLQELITSLLNWHESTHSKIENLVALPPFFKPLLAFLCSKEGIVAWQDAVYFMANRLSTPYITSYLTMAGVNFNIQNANGDTLLHETAAVHNMLQDSTNIPRLWHYRNTRQNLIKDLLVDECANPDLKNSDGETPLDLALQAKRPNPAVYQLLESTHQPLTQHMFVRLQAHLVKNLAKKHDPLYRSLFDAIMNYTYRFFMNHDQHDQYQRIIADHEKYLDLTRKALAKHIIKVSKNAPDLKNRRSFLEESIRVNSGHMLSRYLRSDSNALGQIEAALAEIEAKKSAESVKRLKM